MANLEISGPDVSIHARGSWKDAVVFQDGDNGLADLSKLTLFFEVDGIGFRQKLVPDDKDPTIQWLVLGRTQVEKLTRSALPYAIVDETDLVEGDLPIVLKEGTIKYHGYKGLPDTVIG